MPDEISIEVKGLAEVTANLDQLGDAFAYKALRAALRDGGAVFQRELEVLAPAQAVNRGGDSLPAGALRGDMRTKLTGLTMRVGPSKLTAHVARWLEFGHRMVTHGKRVVGFVPAHPFMRKAFDLAAQPAAEAVTERLQQEIKDFKPASTI